MNTKNKGVTYLKQNTKFLWIYIAILFSFALILIVFAGLTQNNYQKEIEQQASESAGVKQSLVTLTDENQKMSDSIKDLTSEVDGLKTENFRLTSQKEILLKSIGGDAAVTQTLLDAYVIFAVGDTEAAANKLTGIDKAQLNQTQLNIYNTIIGE